MIEWAFLIHLALSTVGIIAAGVRLWQGPTTADRLLAADLATVLIIGLLVAGGVKSGEQVVIDVALVAALVLFFGTAAAVQLLGSERLKRSEYDD